MKIIIKSSSSHNSICDEQETCERKSRTMNSLLFTLFDHSHLLGHYMTFEFKEMSITISIYISSFLLSNLYMQ